jgi:hypothetical protein
MSIHNSTRAPAPIVGATTPDTMAEALRDAASWLQSAGDALSLPCLKDAAARA